MCRRLSLPADCLAGEGLGDPAWPLSLGLADDPMDVLHDSRVDGHLWSTPGGDRRALGEMDVCIARTAEEMMWSV